MYAIIGVLELDVLCSRLRSDANMNENMIPILIFGIWGVIAAVVVLIWIFIKPEDDLCDMCGLGLAWPIVLVLLVILIILIIPYKLFEPIQKKILERMAKNKYYNEDEYRSENEDWYSEDEYGSAYIEANYKDEE